MIIDPNTFERFNAVLTGVIVPRPIAFVSTKITFGNMIAQICERLPDAHVDIVTSALGMDSRIGRKYIKGGIGYGGPCLDRDNVALVAMSNNIGAKALLA